MIVVMHHHAYRRAHALAAAKKWQELGVLAADPRHAGDVSFMTVTAAVAFIEGRPDYAMAASRLVLERAPAFNRQIAFWILGYAAAQQGHSEAVAADIASHLGWHLHRHRRRLKRTPGFKEAEDALHSALAIQDLDSLWNDLGVLYYSFGYIDEAIFFLGQCLTRDPAHRRGTINFAVALLTQGRTKEAQAYVDRTDFAINLPANLVLNGLIQKAAAQAAITSHPRDYSDWNRRCRYSYDWRRSLTQLFLSDQSHT